MTRRRFLPPGQRMSGRFDEPALHQFVVHGQGGAGKARRVEAQVFPHADR